MKARYFAAAAGLVLAAGVAAAAPTASAPAWVTAAVADSTRPAADTARDAERLPADMLTFAGVKPGQTVVDFMPGGGYFSRLFSAAVGAKGTVYAFTPAELAKMAHGPMPANGAHPDAARPNITAIVAPVDSFAVPTPADIVWTSQNYHDLHDPFMGPADMKVFDLAVFKALKPGGVFIVEDHSAPDGSGVADTNTLHRIDESVVKTEVEAAGFQFVAEDNSLRNPADTRTLKVFDPAIRGHTDQFVLKFRKPR
ncbi:MAG TPA: methyltransferase [Caulobacteraceae bacterium]|jgi:predicted methyltransferase|nr:methyltransferase [Caulobacteraceae bacterium]